MAQIKLNVIADTSKATANLKTLETQIKGIADNLAKTTTAKGGLTAPLNETGKAAKASAQNVDTLRKSYANLLAQIKTLEKQYGGEIFKGVKKEVDAHLQQIKNLTAADKENSQILGQLSKDYKKLAADVAQYRAEETKLATADSLIPKTGNTLSRLESGWANLANSIKNVEKYYPKGTFDAIKTQIDAQTKSVAALRAEYVANNNTLGDSSIKVMNDSTAALLEQRAAFDQTKNSAKNYHGTLLDTVSGFLKFQVSAMLVMKPLQLLQSALSSINETLVETEKVVVSIQRVLDEDVASGEISSELYAIAQNLGQSFDNVQEIAQNFAKAGLSWQDTLKATEAAVLALNVAELTAEESSEGLIAVMQQFNYEASELTYVIDVLNKAADKSAVDTQELLVALQKTGSYASAANLSLEQTVGLISALSEATAASGQNIGNALKSLFAYSSKSSSLEMFASLSEEMKAVVDMYQIGNASILDVWEKLADTMESLSTEQANLLEQWSSESGLETELGAELSEVYDQLTGVYDTAGVYRKNYFIALLNNFEEVRDVMGEISDAQGYTNEEQAKYMDTYEAKLNALQAKWQEIANDEQGLLAVKKWLLDIASELLDFLQNIGGLRTILLAAGTAMTAIIAPKVINGFISLGKAIVNIKKSFDAAKLSTVSFGTALSAAIGIVGTIFTVISLVTGAIDQANEEAEQLIDETLSKGIETFQSLQSEIESTAKDYEDFADRVSKARSILDDENSTASDLYNAKKALLDIQKQLAEQSNNSYANSIDLVNGKLKEQLDLIDKLGDQKLKEQIEEYLRNNADAIYNANKYLTDEHTRVQFTETTGFWSSLGDVTLSDWLTAQGYDSVIDTDFWSALGSFFSDAKNFNTYLETEGKTITEQIALLEELYDKAGQESDKELSEYLQAQIRAAINTLQNDSSYQNALKLIYGDEDASNWIERLPLETLQKIVDGTISIEEAFASVNEEVEETGDNLDDQIKKIETLHEDTVKGLISDLKEIRDTENEAAEIEDKRLAVAEAKTALAEAEAEAAERLAEAQEKVADAEKSINEERLELIEQQKEAQEELAEAQQDAEDARLDLLEKQQAVLEAQKALEEARNNRSRYVFNNATGQWEWRENQKDIQEAQEELETAQEAEAKAKEQYENTLQAIKDAETELENINATIADAEKAIEEAIAQGYDISKEIVEEQKNIATGVRDAIQAYIEAQQAVKDQQAENKENIANAQEALEKAMTALNEYFEDQAWDNVISELESGNATNDSIKAILDKWRQEAVNAGAQDAEWYTKIIEAINKSAGVDISTTPTLSKEELEVIGSHSGMGVVDADTMLGWINKGTKSYDSGGIADGKGFLAKATSVAESVNNPELTRKILEPTSNAQFDRYVRDMGILFETARDYAAIRPIMQSTVGNTTTTNNNSNNTYAISDVKIGSDMLSRPFGEVLQMMTLVPRKS